MKKILVSSLMLVVALTACVAASEAAHDVSQLPKHEFRGAWMHIIGQQQYAQMSPEQTRHYLLQQLDLLQQAHCNAIIWQVRPLFSSHFFERFLMF